MKNQLNEYMLDTLIPGGYESGNVSRMVQGNSIGYSYNIRSLNRSLEQKVNDDKEEYYIHPGSLVRGRGMNNPDKTYTGYVNRILKDFDGSVIGLYIMTTKNKKLVTISADDNLELLIVKGEEEKEPMM